MLSLRLRPTFDIQLSVDRETAITRLEQAAARSADQRLFMMFGEYGELHLAPQVHRLWSPHLSFYVYDRGDGCTVHGRFAPRLDVWTFVWVIYLATAFSAFFGAALGYSQWAIGETSWGFWVAIAALLCLLGVYLVANIGQQLSADQMRELRDRLENLLADNRLVVLPGPVVGNTASI